MQTLYADVGYAVVDRATLKVRKNRLFGVRETARREARMLRNMGENVKTVKVRITRKD